MRPLVKLLIAVNVVFCLLVPIETKAAGSMIKTVDINAILQENGGVSVENTLSLEDANQLSWSIFSDVKNLRVLADNRELGRNQFTISQTAGRVTVSTETNATTWRLLYSSINSLIRHNDRDQFFFKVFQQPGVTIGQTNVRFTLPTPITANLSESFSGNVYAIGGVIGAETTRIDNQTLAYRTGFADSQAVMTISASWPNTILNLTRGQEIRLAISNLDSLPWVILGIALPLGALIVLIGLTLKQHVQDRGKHQITATTPPLDISPLIAGVLVHKKIYPEEIVALLVDLCQRGYLVIIKKNDQYYLGVRRLPDEHLHSWERDILGEILPTTGVVVTDTELKEVSKQTLFNPQVRDAFAEIYQVITKLQYFNENPHLTRVRYKLVGLFFYFIGLGGLIWTAVTDATPYLLIPLTGTIVISWLIMRLTKQLTSYTDNGLLQRDKWLAFGRHLGSDQPLAPELSRNHTFEKYLPYAIVLGQTVKWAERFDNASTVIIAPDWFINYDSLTATELATQIVDFTTRISRMLSNQRGPLVS